MRGLGIGNEYTYTGSPIDGDDMEISVHDRPTLLAPGKDYEVRYENNTAVTGEGEPARVISPALAQQLCGIGRADLEILPIGLPEFL